MTTYWLEQAWLGGAAADSAVLLTVEGGRITAVETGIDLPPADSVQLHGLTLPAFANAHSHAFHRALRGRTHSGQGSFWTWRDQMYGLANRLDPESYLRLARAVFGEMASAGIGVVGEFHYLHHQPDGRPYDDDNAMGAAIVAAAADAGIRLTLLDTLYLHGGFATGGSEPYAPLEPHQRRFSDGSVWTWVERVRAAKLAHDSEAVTVGGAIHSVRAVDPMAVRVASEWAAEQGAPLHAHVSEQPRENEQCEARFSWSPVELLHREEAVGPNTTLIHATHIDEADVERIADAGATVCFCPTTERDLADGVGPGRALAGAGVPLALGTDSHAMIDPFEEARALELDERLTALERGIHGPADLLAMGTTNGYRALGWPDGGRLAVGNLADFTTVRLDSIRTAGTGPENALGAAVFAAAAPDVVHLVVGGRVVVENGVHTSFDVAGELDAAIAAVFP